MENIKVIYTTVTFNTKFGEWLAERMARGGMTINDVAKCLCISRQTVSNHLHGRVKPTLVMVLDYCCLFDYYGNPLELLKLAEEFL